MSVIHYRRDNVPGKLNSVNNFIKIMNFHDVLFICTNKSSFLGWVGDLLCVVRNRLSYRSALLVEMEKFKIHRNSSRAVTGH